MYVVELRRVLDCLDAIVFLELRRRTPVSYRRSAAVGAVRHVVVVFRSRIHFPCRRATAKGGDGALNKAAQPTVTGLQLSYIQCSDARGNKRAELQVGNAL
jgi:hypothetical protein